MKNKTKKIFLMSSPWRCNRFIKRAFVSIQKHVNKNNEREYAIGYTDVKNVMDMIQKCQGPNKILFAQDILGNRRIVQRVGYQTINNTQIPVNLYTTIDNSPMMSDTTVELICRVI